MINITTQEILLMSHTTFSAREYTDKNENQPSKDDSQHNKLAEICWNGMIPEMLPELFVDINKPLTMWQLEECRHLLYVHLGEDSMVPDPEFTVNPYVLMAMMNEN